MVKELIEIATKGDIERLRELFEDPESIYSTDPAQALNKRDKDGKSALDIAAMLGRKEIVRELLERGAEINSQTKKGIFKPISRINHARKKFSFCYRGIKLPCFTLSPSTSKQYKLEI